MQLVVITREIDFDFNDLGFFEVEFTVEMVYGNHGIGAYEFWGTEYTQDDYAWDVASIEWNTDLYSKLQNKYIKDYFKKNLENIEEEASAQLN